MLNLHIVSRARDGLVVRCWTGKIGNPVSASSNPGWAFSRFRKKFLPWTTNLYLTYMGPMGVRGNKAFYSGVKRVASGASLDYVSY